MKINRHALMIAVSAVVVLCGLLFAPGRKAAERQAPAEGVASGIGGEAEAVAVDEASADSPGTGVIEPPAESRAVRPDGNDPGSQIAALLAQGWDVSNPELHADLLQELKRLEDLRARETEAKARELGLPLVTEAGAALVGFEGEMPLYDISHNDAAAISIATDLVRETLPYNVDGKDRRIGLWDVGFAPREDHQELAGKIEVRDDAFPGGLHATHVAGTMIGNGINPSAQGMAPQAKIWAYSSTDVLTELFEAASTSDSDFGKLMVSVHPYGTAGGWELGGLAWFGVFNDDENQNNDYVPIFGQYNSNASSWDGFAETFPYHLIVKSAGNHRDDKRPSSNGDDVGPYWSLNATPTVYEFDPEDHPKNDKRLIPTQPRGFGLIDARGSAKNVLTVGAVDDAVTGGQRDLSAAILGSYSSAGPTDDGRIKPDVVANGTNVVSADGQSTDGYTPSSGTSMAAASAGGSALLLVDLQKDLSGKALRSSTLKGLLIHTADDIGNPGPDYRHGWGLMNVERAAQLLVEHDGLVALERAVLREDALRSADDNDYYVIDHDGASPLRVTVCWTDVPAYWTSGHDNRTPRLVNDLNVCLVGPDSTVYHPYVMPFTSTFAEGDLDALATTGVNSVDNVEQIYVPNAPAGQYTLQINLAGALTGFAQDYSLLLSGCTIGGPGVEVENPVADQSYLTLNTDKIDNVADVDDVFSDQDHTYGISWTPNGLLSAVIAGDGTVDLFLTGAGFGTVEITLTADDDTGGFASDSFFVTLRPETMFVSMNTPAGPAQQDGTSWATAYRHLRDGLAGAVEGQEIWVAQGIYYPDVDNAGDTDARDRSFAMVAGIPMYGGFVGGETTRDERDPHQYLAILSGDISQDDEQRPIATRVQPNPGAWNNSYRVVDMAACEDDDLLDGFVITAGHADNWPFNTDGAGVSTLSDVLINNCWITGNYAYNGGGGIHVVDDNPIISKCRIAGNEAGSSGGGVYLYAGQADFYNCEFRGNQAADGGAIYLVNPQVDFLNCVVSGNTGLFGGGGIHMAGGKLKVINSTLTGNHTSGSGGAVKVVTAAEKPVFQNVIIWGNHGAGSTTTTAASAHYIFTGDEPKFYNCLVANSGGSTAWNTMIGIDEEGNLDLDPMFVEPLAPSPTASEAGNFMLPSNSPGIDAGLKSFLLADRADLDEDGDTGEKVDVDLVGADRVVSAEIDLGSYEFTDLGSLDFDGDGLSDLFEITHGGDLFSLDPMSDLDGDGWTAQAEFLYGGNPNVPDAAGATTVSKMNYLGSDYLTFSFEVDPAALPFVDYMVQRRCDSTFELGWFDNQTVEVSVEQSARNPGLWRVTHRSLATLGPERLEFLRMRIDVAAVTTPSLPGGLGGSPWTSGLGGTAE